MSASVRASRALLALALCAALALAAAARAQGGPTVGGEVPSVLELSLGEPGPFACVPAGRGRRVCEAAFAVAVTATEGPTRLSVADGEALAGRRVGRLVRGSSVFGIPLRAAAAHGSYRSLHSGVAAVLQQWGGPVSLAPVTVRLRQLVRGRRPAALGAYHKLLLVTVTAAGP